MKILADLLYTKNHEWIRVEGGVGFIGITDFAQSELGDIVFIEIETTGETLKKEDAFGTVEAVKTVSDLFMPVGGEVLEVNPELENQPALVNSDPYGRGWMIKVGITDPTELSELMTAEEYKSIAEA
ncbi:MAG: glycine cleavage system protein GcvH [Bacteroidales bacterium]|jgi:glycine cleavage system H protein|nr:glycine cleavage system protein GcvH [Bacteroidales bacterium]